MAHTVPMSLANTTKKVPSAGTFSADIAGLGARDTALLRAVQRSGRAVVRLDRDRALFAGLAGVEMRKAFARLARRGWLRRVERGAYVVLGPGGTQTQRELAIVADWLDGQEYAVSGFAALAFWDLTQHAPTRVDILIAGRWKQRVRYGALEFRFVRVARERSARAQNVRLPGARAEVRIATPERALVDAAAGPHAVALPTLAEALDRGLRHGRIQRRRLLREVATAPRAAARRLGWLAAQRGDPLAERLERLVGRSGYVLLDPQGRAALAPRDTQWRVVANIDPEDLAR